MNTIRTSLAGVCILFAVFLQQEAKGQTDLDLGAAAPFSILGGSGDITFAPTVNSITGDIGLYPGTSITGLTNVVLVGVNHMTDAVSQVAHTNLSSALTTGLGLSGTPLASGSIGSPGGQTLTPGVYNATSTLGVTGNVTLSGGPNSVFIFVVPAALTTASSSVITLTGGAQASNVFWVVGSSATLGTDSTFVGSILADASISIDPNVLLDGQALAEVSVTLAGNDTITLPLASVITTGPTITNSGPGATPDFANFTVVGTVTAGTPTQGATVNSLTFTPGSVLDVLSTLTVTSGNIMVPNGVATINGGTVIVPGDYTETGSGTLVANTNLLIGGNANINGGALVNNGFGTVGGNVNVNPGAALVNNGSLQAGGGLNVNGGAFVNNGIGKFGGNVNINGGALVDNGTLTAAGSVNVNQGVLTVNGTLQAPQTNVAHGALLNGVGTIIGNVSNSGTVAPGGASPGTLTIQGNFSQHQGGTLDIRIASPSVFDQLIVSGTASVSGTLNVSNVGIPLKYGEQIPFLQAGRIVGRFDQIILPDSSLFRGRFLNEGNVGVLLVAPASYTLVARTPNETRLAQALNRWIGIETGDIGAVTLALDLLNSSQYAAAFQAISPGLFGSVLSTRIELNQDQGLLLSQQLSSRMLGQQGATAESAHIIDQGYSGKDAKSPAPQPLQPEVEAADQHWSVWTQASGYFSAGGMSLTPGETFKSGAILVGADHALGPHVAVGIFASYEDGWGNYPGGESLDLKTALLGGYATVNYDGFYGFGAVAGGWTDYEVNRPIQWATLNRIARSSPDGSEFFAMLGGGYDFHAGNFTFGPALSAQYTRTNLDGFTEQGANSLDLRIQDAAAQSLRSYIGGRIAYSWKVDDRITIIPELRGFWQHEYLQGTETLQASLNGGDGPGFSYLTPQAGRDAIFAGAGVGFLIGRNFTLSVYYNAIFGSYQNAQNIVSITAQWKF